MATNLSALVASAKKSFQLIDPKGERVQWGAEANYAMQILSGWKQDILRNTDPDSVRNSVVNVASAGLSLNPALGLAYLVPRDGKCCLDISYKGLVQLATDSGSIRYVQGAAVREKDHFLYRGFHTLPAHEFNPFSGETGRGEIIGVYCAAKTSDGDWLVTTMSREEIEKVRATSKAPNSPAWENWYDQMALKACIKRAQKLYPRSAREAMAGAIQVSNEIEGLREDQLSDREYYAMPRATDEPPAPAVDKETGEVIEGEFSEPGDAPPPEEEKQDAPLADGPRKVALSKLKSARVSEDQLFEAFKVKGWDEIRQHQINDVLGWIEEQAK